MATVFNYPPTNSEFPSWLDNFYKFLDLHAAALGISKDIMDKIKAIRDAENYLEDCRKKTEKYLEDLLNARNLIHEADPDNAGLPIVKLPVQPVFDAPPADVPSNRKAFLKDYVIMVRGSTLFTHEQKRSAGVLSKERKTIKPADAKPVLTVEVVNGQAVLDCPLLNFRGYEVWMSLTGRMEEATLLNNSTARNFTDKSALPNDVNVQQRTYFVRYISLNNTPVGVFSNHVTVAVTRMPG